MPPDFQHLLALRDARRAACPSSEIDAIVITDLKGKLLSALYQATGALNQIDTEHRPALSARVDAELRWINAIIAAFAGPDA